MAIYFACRSNQPAAANVWAISRYDDVRWDLDILKLATADVEGKGPFDHFWSSAIPTRGRRRQHAVKLVHPFYNSPRLSAQDGAFTIHSVPRRRLDSYRRHGFTPEQLDISHLVKWTIHARDKKRLISELDALGVNRRTAFPELDGIACSLWESEVLHRGVQRSRRGRL